MKVGTLCYSTNQGLGILARDFHKNGVVTDVMVVSHGHHPNNYDWYPNAPIITNLSSEEQRNAICSFCVSMDVMLFFETPFWWGLIDYCKSRGTKTVLIPMYECMPTVWPATPDLIINPSYLDQECFPNGVHIPIPVDVPWKQRTEAKVFVHNSGHGGLKGRNGTKELLDAIPLVKADAKFIIRSQHQIKIDYDERKLANTKFVHGTIPYEQLWNEGDVFVFPERHNALSLPLQEARASGMLVMCGDRFPMNMWLPRDPLIRVEGYQVDRIGPAYHSFKQANFTPATIAAKIDQYYGKDITRYSTEGKEWADMMSWERLKPLYMDALQGLLE